jgi:hypothetical protein
MLFGDIPCVPLYAIARRGKICDPITALAITGAVITAGGMVYQGQAQQAQAKYESKIANRNAELEERSRRDAIARGETEQRNHYRKLAQAMGEARVKSAAAGLDVSFGSAANLEQDIELIGYEDSATIAENVSKEVQGYDINAANYRSEAGAALARGKAAKTASYIGAAGTLLSSASQIGAMNVGKGNNWYGGPKKTGGTSLTAGTSGSWVGPRG